MRTRFTSLSDDVTTRFKVKVHRSGTLLVPVFDRRGKAVNELSIDKHNLSKASAYAQKSCALYNSDSIPPQREYLLVTFAIPAVWKLWELGFPDVVGLLSATICSSQLDFIRRSVRRTGIVWVITDGTGPALQLGVKVAGKVATVRFTRHVFIKSKEIVACTFQEIQDLFTRS